LHRGLCRGRIKTSYFCTKTFNLFNRSKIRCKVINVIHDSNA
jgi:hypothetical protein